MLKVEKRTPYVLVRQVSNPRSPLDGFFFRPIRESDALGMIYGLEKSGTETVLDYPPLAFNPLILFLKRPVSNAWAVTSEAVFLGMLAALENTEDGLHATDPWSKAWELSIGKVPGAIDLREQILLLDTVVTARTGSSALFWNEFATLFMGCVSALLRNACRK